MDVSVSVKSVKHSDDARMDSSARQLGFRGARELTSTGVALSPGFHFKTDERRFSYSSPIDVITCVVFQGTSTPRYSEGSSHFSTA
jgi:hypothetical protein